MLKIIYPIAIFTFITLFSGCATSPQSKKENSPPRPWQKAALPGFSESIVDAFGVPFTIRIWGAAKPSVLQAAALAEIGRITAFADATNPKSLVSQINARAFEVPVTVTPELAAILSECSGMYDLSEQKFDITFVPYKSSDKSFNDSDLNKITDWDKKDPTIKTDLRLFGQANMLFTPSSRQVRLYNRRTKLNLKGMIRGYIAQKVSEILSGQKLSGFAVIADSFFAASGVALTDPGLMCIENPDTLGTCFSKITAATNNKTLFIGTSFSLERKGDLFDPKDIWSARSGGVIIAGENGSYVQFAATVTSMMNDKKLSEFLSKTTNPKLTGVYFSKELPRHLVGKLTPFAN